MRLQISSLLILSFSAIIPTFASAESVKVFLLAGHSNISGGGRADNLGPEWNVPQEDVWIWLDHNIDGVGDWVTLGPGHGDNTHNIRPDEPEGISPPGDRRLRVGPELSLGRTLADAYPEDRIALIKHANGGGRIDIEWNPRNLGPPESLAHRWSGLLQKSSDAFQALEAGGHSYEVEGFFWSLDARDARNVKSNSEDPDEVLAGREEALTRSAQHGEGLTNLIGAVRDEFGADLPFVIAMSDHFPQDLVESAFPGMPLVRESQLEIAALDPWTTAFSTEGLTVHDNVHFDATGQVEHGIRFADAYFDLMSQSTPGDYNGDGRVNVLDIDLQSLAMSEPNPDLNTFDENDDGAVDVADRNILVNVHVSTFYGDANLDGEFNTNDLVAVFQAGQYEDGIAQNSTWASGDWNGDGEFGTNDLVLAFQDRGFEQGPRESLNTVPEPSGAILSIAGVLLLGVRNRRRPDSHI